MLQLFSVSALAASLSYSALNFFLLSPANKHEKEEEDKEQGEEEQVP